VQRSKSLKQLGAAESLRALSLLLCRSRSLSFKLSLSACVDAFTSSGNSRPRGKVTHSLAGSDAAALPVRKIAIKADAQTAGRIVALENCSATEVAAQAPLSRQPSTVSRQPLLCRPSSIFVLIVVAVVVVSSFFSQLAATILAHPHKSSNNKTHIRRERETQLQAQLWALNEELTWVELSWVQFSCVGLSWVQLNWATHNSQSREPIVISDWVSAFSQAAAAARNTAAPLDTHGDGTTLTQH